MRTFTDRLVAARSFLFVAGHQPDRFAKAAACGADVVIVDLEDAVADEDKDRARAHVAAWLAQGNEAVVRINPPGTPWFEPDLVTVGRSSSPVVVPKADDDGVLAEIARRTDGRCPLVPLIETSTGIERAREVCAADGVVRVAFGNVDLAAELGIAHDDRAALTYARSRVAIAAAAAGLAPPVDGVTVALDDAEALAADVTHARRLGFGGKLCIHPRQVPGVAQGFLPTDSEREWASAVAEAGDSVTRVNGQMVDKPVLERARRILAADQAPTE